jgi:tRNA modification GTPase
VEAAIDFPEEEIDFISDGGVAARLDDILKTLLDIKAHVTQGLIVREGISIVIAGRPNAGKSTLINALAERDVAIVTDIPGTTRDVMRQSILIDDLPVYVIDTAGLRDSTDRIEQEGIKRAWDEIRLADCVLMVMDCLSEESPDVLYESISTALAPDVPVIWVFNKIDKSNTKTPRIVDNRIYLSAKSGGGLNLLKDAIKTTVGYAPTEGQFLARRRHLDALDKAEQLLSRGQHQLMTYRAGELLAEDLRLAHQSLCSITGEFTSDDLLGEIFSSFCIGK